METLLTFIFNLIYASYNAVIALLTHSLWFLASSAFYAVLAVTKLAVLIPSFHAIRIEGKADGAFMLKATGLLLLALDAALSAVLYGNLASGKATKYDEIIMLTIATYVFARITANIVKAVSRQRDKSPGMTALRTIGYAEVAVSVLTLQRSMIATYNTDMAFEQIHLMNTLSGAAVSLFIVILGISLIRKGKWLNRKS